MQLLLPASLPSLTQSGMQFADERRDSHTLPAIPNHVRTLVLPHTFPSFQLALVTDRKSAEKQKRRWQRVSTTKGWLCAGRKDNSLVEQISSSFLLWSLGCSKCFQGSRIPYLWPDRENLQDSQIPDCEGETEKKKERKKCGVLPGVEAESWTQKQ